MNGSNDIDFVYAKTSLDEGWDAYLASSSTHVYHEVFLVD